MDLSQEVHYRDHWPAFVKEVIVFWITQKTGSLTCKKWFPKATYSHYVKVERLEKVIWCHKLQMIGGNISLYIIRTPAVFLNAN